VPTDLSPEALGLVMAVLDGPPAAADVDDLAGSAPGKVVRALPESVGRQAAALREHASAAPDRYPARPDPATTSALVAAVAARRRVLVTYRSEPGNEWEAEVPPRAAAPAAMTSIHSWSRRVVKGRGLGSVTRLPAILAPIPVGYQLMAVVTQIGVFWSAGTEPLVDTSQGRSGRFIICKLRFSWQRPRKPRRIDPCHSGPGSSSPGEGSCARP
jgi:hypothetical protein